MPQETPSQPAPKPVAAQDVVAEQAAPAEDFPFQKLAIRINTSFGGRLPGNTRLRSLGFGASRDLIYRETNEWTRIPIWAPITEKANHKEKVMISFAVSRLMGLETVDELRRAPIERLARVYGVGISSARFLHEAVITPEAREAEALAKQSSVLENSGRRKLAGEKLSYDDLSNRIRISFGGSLPDDTSLTDLGVPPDSAYPSLTGYISYDNSSRHHWSKLPIWAEVYEGVTPREREVITRSIKRLVNKGLRTVGDLRRVNIKVLKRKNEARDDGAKLLKDAVRPWEPDETRSSNP